MVTVPAGCFTLGARDSVGNEAPPTPLTVPYPFAIGRTEVTVGNWRACAAEGKCKVEAPAGDPNVPMTRVAHADAEDYANWLKDKTSKPYRLPSEAEWEYAARAGSADEPYGKGITVLTERHALFTGATTPAGPVAVGSYPPNDFGLVDMLGNVAEWVADCYAPSHAERPPNIGPRSACAARATGVVDRVVRGGSFRQPAARLRVSYRDNMSAASRADNIGFRLARDLPDLPRGEPVRCPASTPRSSGGGG
jgi:formylglycine-generating enzyme required for sulfatase activity